MSIAGIAKEVATISVSALLFGDELTPLNITGVAVTICGELMWHSFMQHHSPPQFLTT
jgi:solute carrier family 35 protein C2